MRILIAAIGKAKAGPEKSLYDHYAARLGWPLSLKESEDKKSTQSAQRKQREGELLLAASEEAHVRIALDERGKSMSSVEFAHLLQKLKDQGMQHIAFLIGGADGLDKPVLSACRQSICLGTMTWPHMLVRGLLAEQLYRAQTILSGHPYHRE